MPLSLSRYRAYIYPVLLLLAACVTYLSFYGEPRALFWDENYHIASAQKHIDGVMYMEPHPPLGKMLMAVSETVLGTNQERDKSAFNGTDYLDGDNLPSDMSFYGFRLPSSLLMALSVLFLYGTLSRLCGNRHIAAAFSCLLIFDNALVIHARAAMLEGIQLFFILAAVYYTVRIITNPAPIRLRHYALLGVLIGLAIAVKINASILLLLFVFVYGVDQWPAIQQWRWRSLFLRLFQSVPAGVLPMLAVIGAVFYLHIGMGTELAPHSQYKASPAYLTHIRQGETWSPAAFKVGMQDHWRYMSEYADGVPRLDVCKPGENGSSAVGWPLGTKTINYRWSKHTVDGVTKVRYHTLVPNPVVWFSVAIGVVLSLGLIISRVVYQQPVADRRLFYWISAFTTLYISYMLVILQIERVMYLYHYLVPLVFGMINLALVCSYLFRHEIQLNRRHLWINLTAFVALVFTAFILLAPFTYSWELTEGQFNARNWFDYWKLELVR